MSKIGVKIAGNTYEVQVDLDRPTGAQVAVLVNGQPVEVTVPALKAPDQLEWIVVDGRSYELTVDRDLRWLKTSSGIYPLEVRDLEAVVSRPISGDSRVKAPIPGLITRVLVQPGDAVKAGQPLLVLEAMKMENEIRAPRSGMIKQLNVTAGKGVSLGEVLAEIS